VNYHEPMIRRFAELGPDVSNYLSATTPGYHLLMAGLMRVLPGPVEGVSDVPLRLAGLLAALALVGGLGYAVARRAGALAGAACGCLLGSSVYVFVSAGWLLPDDLAWGCVLAVVALCLRRRIAPAGLVAAGLMVLVTVLIRQSHLWTAAVVWTAGWLSAVRWDDRARTEPFADVAPLWSRLPASLGGLGVAVLATLPAFGAVWWFYGQWGGFVPPIYHSYMQGGSPGVVPLMVLQFAVLGAFFVGYWGPAAVDAWRAGGGGGATGRRGLVLGFGGAAVVGLLVAVLPATTWDQGAGRWSGYWALAQVFPDIAGRTNLVFVLACPAGAAALYGLLRAADRRTRWVVLAALVAGCAALTFNQNAWQRYQEPLVILGVSLLAGSCALQRASAWKLERAARVAGPAALAVVYAGITVNEVAGSRPAVLLDRHPAVEQPLRELWPPSWQAEPPASWLGWLPEPVTSSDAGASTEEGGGP